MKTSVKYLIIIMSLLLVSCEKVIEVDLETAPPKLVVDASIDWIKNTSGNKQVIKLSTTTGYYNTSFPAVSGARIVVTNSSKKEFNFIENANSGEYICTDFLPVIGETYSLNINVNGETYTATETMIKAPSIENDILQNNKGGMAGDEIEITYHYQDNASENNFYIFSNKIKKVAFPQYQVENDENSNGKLTPVYYSHKDLVAGDVVNIKLFGISKQYYSYFKKLLNASGNDDSPFSTIPNAVNGNIINKNNSNDLAYGYFRLSELDVRDYTIK